MPLPKLSRSVIEAAIMGFEQQKIQIDSQISELRAMLMAAPSFLILADTTVFVSARVGVAFLLKISQTETSGLFSRLWQGRLNIKEYCF